MKFYLSLLNDTVIEVDRVYNREAAESFIARHGMDAIVVEVPMPRQIEVTGDKTMIMSIECTETVFMAYFRGSKEYSKFELHEDR